DLLVWYHLAWLGETIRGQDSRVQRLIKKARQFDADDRCQLTQVLAEVLGGIIPRYRGLAEAGQIELSMTPYAHPMLPLLADFESAREAMPDVPLPKGAYPGGIERTRWHLEAGLALFERMFGCRPAGCWPSEGGISDAILPMLTEYGFQWIASGQGVLGNSLKLSNHDTDNGAWPYRPYRLGNLPLFGFFRDDGLSDAIGFTYSDWHGEDAVADLVHHLEEIASKLDAPQAHVVSIIMDGENAWEHYPKNGAYFLDHLYQALSDHPVLKATTYSEFLEHHGGGAHELARVCAGSWVYGTFSTWIGDHDKNRAWDILVESKQAFDEVVASQVLSPEKQEQLERQLAICEGSDWFWWFGDYNPVESIEDFSNLYRQHIRNLHRMLGRPVPAGLDSPFGSGGAAEYGGAMRRGTAG
ncbi:MAG: glycoside hydrolase family 57 protein, partial [Gammaproteobacteria bacterium]|nr:glycoside hydrolase family 57 protein [Gammaproteobacteria bacterium]